MGFDGSILARAKFYTYVVPLWAKTCDDDDDDKDEDKDRDDDDNQKTKLREHFVRKKKFVLN